MTNLPPFRVKSVPGTVPFYRLQMGLGYRYDEYRTKFGATAVASIRAGRYLGLPTCRYSELILLRYPDTQAGTSMYDTQWYLNLKDTRYT